MLETVELFSKDPDKYAGVDAVVTAVLWLNLRERAKDSPLVAVYRREMATAEALIPMTMQGVRVDESLRETVREELTQELRELERYWEALAVPLLGYAASWQSTPDIKALFVSLGSKPGSFDKTKLEKLQEEGAPQQRFFATLVLKLRKAHKQLDFIPMTDADTGKFHPTFGVTTTITGRLSSTDSIIYTSSRNSQNIPKVARKMFLPDEGYEFFAQWDASAGENWTTAITTLDLLGDDRYLKMIQSGDPHTACAKLVWPELVANREDAEREKMFGLTVRDVAKRLGHGTTYHGSARGLAMRTRVPAAAVKRFQTDFLEKTGVGAYHKKVVEELETGWTSNLLGRRLRTWDSGGRALRQALAFKSQSLLADKVNETLVLLSKTEWVRRGDFVMQLQVHDSIAGSLRNRAVFEEITEWFQMATPLGHGIYIKWDGKLGKNWGEV